MLLKISTNHFFIHATEDKSVREMVAQNQQDRLFFKYGTISVTEMQAHAERS